MQENWKSIKGFEGSYEVSDLGRVRSLPRKITQMSKGGGVHVQSKPGKILKGVLNSKGYARVNIGGKVFFVHRLVAEAFIPNPDSEAQVNHKDGDKTNNASDNLEWVSNKANRKHAVENNLHRVTFGETRFNSKLTEEDVRWIRNNYIKGDREYGRQALSRKFNVSHQTIKNVIDRKKWKHVQ